jgi:tetratricopeptide (TPR) repeat protein
LNNSERTLNHLELPSDIRNPILVEVSRMRGDIAIAQGDFKLAKRIFEQRKEELVTLRPTSPVFTRFARSEANYYRNLGEFSEGIRVLQPLFQEKDAINPTNISLLAELLTLHFHEESALTLLDKAEDQLTRWNSIHGLSIIYLSRGYTYLLMEDFENATNYFHNSLDIISSDLVDLKNYVQAHLNLGYLELEKNNFKRAEYHLALAEEKASMSGCLSLVLDSQFLKANLRIQQGLKIKGMQMLEKIGQEARTLGIMFMYKKVQARLNNA